MTSPPGCSPSSTGGAPSAWLPSSWTYRLTDQQELIDADVSRWAEILWPSNEPTVLAKLLYAFPGFRAVFYHRLRHGNPTGALLGRLAPLGSGRASRASS